MQSTLSEGYVRLGINVAEVVRIILRYVSQGDGSQEQQLTVVRQSSNTSNVYEELGQELATISSQIEPVSGGSRMQELITRIMEAVSCSENDDGIASTFFEAIESMVTNRRMNLDAFINTMVFCIKLVRRYRAASPSSWEEKSMWMIGQICELIEGAYQRYNIDGWVQEQGGWNNILTQVRTRYRNFYDYAIQPACTRQTAVTAGTIIIVTVVAFAIWYNW